MDKAQSNGTVSAFSWPDAGKEAFYIHNSLLELASIGQILWKVLIVIFIMVVNGQRITAFVSDCLCGIKATTIHALKTGRFMYAERWRKFKR